MYDHAFLRLNQTNQRQKQDLLDYTVNFSADITTRNGVLFAIRGLIGGYSGRFSTTPFYIKVQSYNNIESRDLWEYHLNLSWAQTNLLVMHLWKLGSTYFNYYFLTEDYSCQLLPLIEIVDPSLHLIDFLTPCY
ncbi:DUF4105 domain-containing protein [Nitrospira defluvii]|nr:DUF4105 domain-containing protein [Nitrospira defluvii]